MIFRSNKPVFNNKTKKNVNDLSNENSFFIVNVRTTESVPRGIFTLNNHVLFRVNNTTFGVIQSE